MFVLEALILTFMTTPLVTWLYPPNKRVRIATSGANFDNVADEAGGGKNKQTQREHYLTRSRFTVVLDKLEHLPAMMALTQLINPGSPSLIVPGLMASSDDKRVSSSSDVLRPAPLVSVEALRLIELSDRVSAVMKSSASEVLIQTDPVLAIFRMFGQLNDLPIVPSLSIVQRSDLAKSVAERAERYGSDMILLPWLPPAVEGMDGGIDTVPSTPKIPVHNSASYNPFDGLFKSANAVSETAPNSAIHAEFVRRVFSESKRTDVALYVDQSTSGAPTSNAQHVLLPFFGGPDDRLALEFVVQLCSGRNVTATVLRVAKKEPDVPLARLAGAHYGGHEKAVEEANMLTVASVRASYYSCGWEARLI